MPLVVLLTVPGDLKVPRWCFLRSGMGKDQRNSQSSGLQGPAQSDSFNGVVYFIGRISAWADSTSMEDFWGNRIIRWIVLVNMILKLNRLGLRNCPSIFGQLRAAEAQRGLKPKKPTGPDVESSSQRTGRDCAHIVIVSNVCIPFNRLWPVFMHKCS